MIFSIPICFPMFLVFLTLTIQIVYSLHVQEKHKKSHPLRFGQFVVYIDYFVDSIWIIHQSNSIELNRTQSVVHSITTLPKNYLPCLFFFVQRLRLMHRMPCKLNHSILKRTDRAIQIRQKAVARAFALFITLCQFWLDYRVLPSYFNWKCLCDRV